MTLRIQRVRNQLEAIELAAAGVEAIGFDLAVIEHGDQGLGLRYLTESLSPLGLAARQRLAAQVRTQNEVLGGQAGTFLEDLRGAAASWLGPIDPSLLANLNALERRAVIAPVPVNQGIWGAAVFMHTELEPSDVPLLALFALQLGSVLGVIDGNERLDRRTVELDLVHRLTVSPLRLDVNELCEQALETVCKTTASEAGTLHRYVAQGDRYELVGEPFGFRGPLVEQYRQFSLPPDTPFGRTVISVPVHSLRESSGPIAEAGFHYAALIPLSLEDHPVGLLCLFRKIDRPFASSDLRTAEILGVQMASLLERHRLYQESRRLYADLKSSYDELARAQAEVVRHERLAALGELAAVMAHEVRNPLGVIFNSLTTLKRVMKPQGDTEMLLNMVGEEADRLNRIVADLLDFARPYELMKKPVAIEPFVLGALDAASQTLPPSLPIKLITRFERQLPPFPIDAHLLRQALINLIVNAAQSMPRGGTVSVSAHIAPSGATPWLTIEVRDEGLGLSTRASEKLFQPFFTTKATGTGLGLAVVKRIVDSHGGEVTARANDDKGTTFVVRLPGGTDRDAVTPPRPSPAAPRR